MDKDMHQSSNSNCPPSDLERKYDFTQTNFEVFTILGYSFKWISCDTECFQIFSESTGKDLFVNVNLIFYERNVPARQMICGYGYLDIAGDLSVRQTCHDTQYCVNQSHCLWTTSNSEKQGSFSTKYAREFHTRYRLCKSFVARLFSTDIKLLD